MKHGILCALLGLILICFGYSNGGFAWILAWGGLSFLLLGAGHFGLGGSVFGKNARGRIPWWSWTLHLPYFLFSESIWTLSCVLGREDAFNHLTEDVVLGRRLHQKEAEQDWVNWVDLTAEFVEPRFAVDNFNYICLPILDAGVPSAEDLAAALKRLKDGKTYVHCAQGHGRTGLFALALLRDKEKIRTLEEGLELLKETRPGVSLNTSQKRFVRDFLARQAPVRS